jgi:hypothetical protein
MLVLAVVLLTLLSSIMLVTQANAEPGVQVLNNVTVTAPAQAAASITTHGGTFTTLILNATSQTMRWKAYVGNVTGRFVLEDGSNGTIYDWNVATIAGEVYASRNSTINWTAAGCAQNTTLQTEMLALNHTITKEDSINRTFNGTVHRRFYVGTTLITNSSCRAIATYVNNSRQAASESATFQEILLQDGQRMVYASLLENKIVGYNSNRFDFQIILPESDVSATPSPYYFWVELS